MKRLRFLTEVEDGNLRQWREQGKERFNKDKARYECLVVIPLSLWMPWEGEGSIAELEHKAGAYLEEKLDQRIDWDGEQMATGVAARRDGDE